MMILSLKTHPKPYHKHTATIILVYIITLLIFSPSVTAQYLSHRSFSWNSNAVFLGIALAVATIIVFVILIVCKFCCKPLPNVGWAEDGLDQQVSKGLDPSVLETLPVFKYSDVAHGGPLECAVCLSSFKVDEDEDDEHKEKEGVLVRLLPKCNHVFHVGCLDQWLKEHATCPLCRIDLFPQSNEFDSDQVGHSGSQVNHFNESTDEVRLCIEEGHFGKYNRWYSMGHSADVQRMDEECWKRFTLNLPEKEKTKFVEVTTKFKTTTSS